MRGPKPPAVNLSDKERQGLDQLLRRHSTPQQIALRGRIVLLAAQGKNNAQVARELGITVEAARRWRTAVAVAAEDRSVGRLEFDSEEIVIDLQGAAVEVPGTYHFRVAGGAVPAQPMLYPYPEDPLLGAARTLRLEWRHPDGRWAPSTRNSAPGTAAA